MPPGDLARDHGRYDAMVRALLGPAHDYRTIRVFEGVLPADPGAHDAYVVTGSSAGVHDGLPWVETLAGFLRAAKGRAAILGICFGHQVMAHAFGGRVAKAPQGWGLGMHRYALCNRPDWMGAAESVVVMASHQDQVVESPPGATVIGTSGFTPNAMIDHGDGAVSFQCHPEFTDWFARDLIATHDAPDIGPELKAAALRSLDMSGDAAIVGGWMERVMRLRGSGTWSG